MPKKRSAAKAGASGSAPSAAVEFTPNEVALRYSVGARKAAVDDPALGDFAGLLAPLLPAAEKKAGPKRENWSAFVLPPALDTLLRAATLGELLEADDPRRCFLTVPLGAGPIPEAARAFTAINIGEDDQGKVTATVYLLAACGDNGQVLRIYADTSENRRQLEVDVQGLIDQACVERDEELPLDTEGYADVLNEKLYQCFAIPPSLTNEERRAALEATIDTYLADEAHIEAENRKYGNPADKEKINAIRNRALAAVQLSPYGYTHQHLRAWEVTAAGIILSSSATVGEANTPVTFTGVAQTYVDAYCKTLFLREGKFFRSDKTLIAQSRGPFMQWSANRFLARESLPPLQGLRAAVVAQFEAAGMPLYAMLKNAQRGRFHLTWKYIADDGSCTVLTGQSDGQKSVVAALKAIATRQNGGALDPEAGVFTWIDLKGVDRAIDAHYDHARKSLPTSAPVAAYVGPFRLPSPTETLTGLESDAFTDLVKPTAYPVELARLDVALRFLLYVPEAALQTAALQTGAEGEDAFLVLGASAAEIQAARSADDMPRPDRARDLHLDSALQPFLQAWMIARGDDNRPDTLLPLRQRVQTDGGRAVRGLVDKRITAHVAACFVAVEPAYAPFTGSGGSPIAVLRGLTAAALQQARVPLNLCLAGKITADNVAADGSLTVGGESYLTDGENSDVQNARALLLRLKEGCARHGDAGNPAPLFTFSTRMDVSRAIHSVCARLAQLQELPLVVRQAARKRKAAAEVVGEPSARHLRQVSPQPSDDEQEMTEAAAPSAERRALPLWETVLQRPWRYAADAKREERLMGLRDQQSSAYVDTLVYALLDKAAEARAHGRQVAENDAASNLSAFCDALGVYAPHPAVDHVRDPLEDLRDAPFELLPEPLRSKAAIEKLAAELTLTAEQWEALAGVLCQRAEAIPLREKNLRGINPLSAERAETLDDDDAYEISEATADETPIDMPNGEPTERDDCTFPLRSKTKPDELPPNIVADDDPRQCHQNVAIESIYHPWRTRQYMLDQMRTHSQLELAPKARERFFRDRRMESWAEWDAMRQGKMPPSAEFLYAEKLTKEQCPGEPVLIDKYGVLPRNYDKQPINRMGPVFGGALLKTPEDILRFMEIYGKENFENYAIKVKGPKNKAWFWAPFHNGNVTRFFNDIYPDNLDKDALGKTVKWHAGPVGSIVHIRDRYSKRLRLPASDIFMFDRTEPGLQYKMNYQSFDYWQDRAQELLDVPQNAKKLFTVDRKREWIEAGLWTPGQPGGATGKKPQALGGATGEANVYPAAIAQCRAIAESPYEERQNRMQVLHDKLHFCRFDVPINGKDAVVYLSFTDQTGEFVDDIEVRLKQAGGQDREAEKALLATMREAAGKRAGKDCPRLHGFPFRANDLQHAWEKKGMSPGEVRRQILKALASSGETKRFDEKAPASCKQGEIWRIECPDKQKSRNLMEDMEKQKPFHTDNQGTHYFSDKVTARIYPVSKYSQRQSRAAILTHAQAATSLHHRTASHSSRKR